MEHQPDEILDGFRLIKKVGSGAEGSVWKAVHQDEEGRMAAIKFGSGEKTPFPELHHPNLVGVEDQGAPTFEWSGWKGKVFAIILIGRENSPRKR